jgi:hypothetical protein
LGEGKMNKRLLAKATIFTTEEEAVHSSPPGQDSRTLAWYDPAWVTPTVSVLPVTGIGEPFNDHT